MKILKGNFPIVSLLNFASFSLTGVLASFSFDFTIPLFIDTQHDGGLK